MKEKEEFFVEAGLANPKILSKDELNSQFFLPRKPLTHKGDFGHCLLISGSYGKAGACILSATATLRMGCGLLTVHIPERLYDILQISVPEAMVSIDKGEYFFSELPDVGKYSAIAIGPGLDTKSESKSALLDFMKARQQDESLKSIPLVLDADALNILSQVGDSANFLCDNIVITPHPKEFERLFGSKTLKEKLSFMQSFCSRQNICIVLKGGVTAIADSHGELFFSCLGNPGMATAGSGDVLTGVILGILAQGFSVEDAAKIGVCLHALSGDLAKEKLGEKSLLARDIIEFLPQTLM